MGGTPAAKWLGSGLVVVGLAAIAGCSADQAKGDPAAAAKAEAPIEKFNQERIDEYLAKGYTKEYVFEGTVTYVGLKYEGKVVVVDLIDANWAVVVENIKVLEGQLPKLNEEGKYAFLIHSPTQFFALTGSREYTSRYRFVYLTKKEPGKDWLWRELIATRVGDK